MTPEEYRRIPPPPQAVEGFPFPPYLVQHDRKIANVHALARSHPQPDNDLEVARWLFSLTEHPTGTRKEKAYALNGDHGPFAVLPDETSLIAGSAGHENIKKIPATTALLTYTAARLEHLLSLQAVSTPEGTDNGISMMLASTLSKLSNAYRAEYEYRNAGPHVLLIAHDLSQYAMRFHEPDHHGYQQSLGHWLHLNIDWMFKGEERLAEDEARLELALALTELGEGPHGYAGRIVMNQMGRGLVSVYEALDKEAEADALETHYMRIPHFDKESESRALEAWAKIINTD